MLVKYYGLVTNDKEKSSKPRSEFLNNGFFRITQPVFLNDKGSETRLFPYFDEFSPADLVWARKKHDEVQVSIGYEPSQDELERQFLKPIGTRYGEAFPHLVSAQSKFDNIGDLDKHDFEYRVKKINEFIIQALSCKLGVFSLSKTDVNEHMWTHYASEGKGIAVSFDKNHPFFLHNTYRDVSYREEDRASFSYYKGNIRINGQAVDVMHLSSYEDPMLIFSELIHRGVDVQDLANKLLYSKSENWAIEDEVRVVFNLASCEIKKGDIFEPELDGLAKATSPILFESNPEICLKKIPFDAFSSIVFGYDIDPEIKEEIIIQVKDNVELSHLKFKEVSHDIFGKLRTKEIEV